MFGTPHFSVHAANAASIIAAAALFAAITPGSSPAQDTVSRTVIRGGGASGQCARYVANGETSDRAVEICTRALTDDLPSRERVAVLANRGVLLMRRGEGDAALADFDGALLIEPENATLQVNRGAALVALRRYSEAVAPLTQSLSLGVEQPYKAYYNRAAAREALGDKRGAFEDYSTALEIQPEWAPAEAEIARFVRERRDALSVQIAEDEAYEQQQ